MSTLSRARPGEVWLAYVRFANHPDVGKVHPVVIIDGITSALGTRIAETSTGLLRQLGGTP